MLYLAISNLQDGDVLSASISKDDFMKAPDESGVNKYFTTEKSTDWIATDGKRCTDHAPRRRPTTAYEEIPGDLVVAKLSSLALLKWLLERLVRAFSGQILNMIKLKINDYRMRWK